MSKVIGVVYPVPINLIERLFNSERSVFVKYLPHATKVNLKPRDKILFYASRASKQIVGEAVIRSIEFLTPSEALSKHGDRLLLTREELAYYTAAQPTRTSAKKMIVLTMDRARRYAKPLRCEKAVTMAGEYITEERYKLLSESARANECPAPEKHSPSDKKT